MSAMTAGLLVLCAAAFPPESLPALDAAKLRASQGDWGGAIDAYAEHLGKLTTRDYRDKKTFDWILEEFEKAAADGKPDYAVLEKAAQERLPKAKAKPDPILTWRLHLLLARLAEKREDSAAVQAALDAAIAAYPEVNYGDPDRQSRLQHLYNEAALLRAKDDPAEGEKYLLDSFAKDARFTYVHLVPWREFYIDAKTPEKYADLVRRVDEAYAAKAEASPDQADTLTHYRHELAKETAPQ